MKTLTLIATLLLTFTCFAQANDSIYIKLSTYVDSCSQGADPRINFFKIEMPKDDELLYCEFDKIRINTETKEETLEASFEIDFGYFESNYLLLVTGFTDYFESDLSAMNLDAESKKIFSNLSFDRDFESEEIMVGQLSKLQNFSIMAEEGIIDPNKIIDLSKPYENVTNESSVEVVKIIAKCEIGKND